MTHRQRTARALAFLSPAVRRRGRHVLSLGRWCWLRATGDQHSEYGDPFWEFHAHGDWEALADLVVTFCAPQSVVDVGCGDGKLLAALRERSSGLNVLGIDSSKAALTRAGAAGVPVEWHDLASRKRQDMAQLRARVAEFDVAISLETAEHLPPWVGTTFVASLARTRIVIFSAAHVDQGGTMHLNERPAAYWRERFERVNFRPAAFETPFREALAKLRLPWWYAANMHVFERST